MEIEYLEGESPDCPLIRIYGSDPSEFLVLHDVSLRVAEEDKPLFVGSIQGFHPMDGSALEMVSSADDVGVLRIGTVRFRWELTRSMWLVVAGLIEPFTRDVSGAPYQWLCGKRAPYGLGVGAIGVLISASPTGTW